MTRLRTIVLALTCASSLVLSARPVTAQTTQPATQPSTQPGEAAIGQWQRLISAHQLADQLADEKLLIIDVRTPAEYAAGHIPNAINIPGDIWRTPSAKPGAGDSQYIFRKSDGSPDVARYEALLSKHGVSNDHKVVIYGSHGGKVDGSVPAMILLWLGHENVSFLHGIGLTRWTDGGYNVSTEPRTLEASKYTAAADADFIWTLDDVLANLKKPDVVFVDTRSYNEWIGKDTRDNKRTGRIPGAVRWDYTELMDKQTKCTLPPAEIARQLAERGITPEQTVVLYCQTATRVSENYMAMKELGFKNVVIYDGSMHEYGNRDDTPLETPADSPRDR